tara:strand:+ start:26522 stop:26656 length:135 start_codon:yes stop_codon:yes gene_type:complete
MKGIQKNLRFDELAFSYEKIRIQARVILPKAGFHFFKFMNFTLF